MKDFVLASRDILVTVFLLVFFTAVFLGVVFKEVDEKYTLAVVGWIGTFIGVLANMFKSREPARATDGAGQTERTSTVVEKTVSVTPDPEKK